MIPASTCSKLHCGLARTSLVARAGQKARHFAPSAARWGETGCVGGSDVEQAKLTHDWAQPIFGWHHGKKGMRDKSRWQVGERKGERIGKVRSGAAAQRRRDGTRRLAFSGFLVLLKYVCQTLRVLLIEGTPRAFGRVAKA